MTKKKKGIGFNKKTMKYDWTPFFPEDRIPRKEQIYAINFALKTFLEDNKKFCILELPTGVGKSYIATTISGYLNSLDCCNASYVLTTQIILQDQYKKEFPDYGNVSAKGNYRCNKFNDANCAEVKWFHDYGGLEQCDECPYKIAKDEFSNCDISITNTNFFMCNLQYNEQFITNRNLLIVDEAHKLEEDIIKYKGVDIAFNDLSKEHGLTKELWIKEDNNDTYFWLNNFLHTWISDKIAKYKDIIEKINPDLGVSTNSVLFKTTKKLDFLDKLISQINRVNEKYSNDRWVIDTKHKEKTISIKPLYAYDFANEVMFRKAKFVLLMSGTILNSEHYSKSIGITSSNYNAMSVDSPFDVEKRKIYLIDSGSMSQKNIDKTLPRLINNIKKIIKLHEGQRGIIHTSSHKLAQMIYDEIKSNRLIIASDLNNNRNDMLQMHSDSDDTILLSPSLTEGVDLKDDLSRFQIIAKIPFPYLGDKYTSIKMKKIANWYSYQTAKTLIQSYGRSVRNSEDFATTYILDSDADWFIKRNKNMFPKFFLEALEIKKI